MARSTGRARTTEGPYTASSRFEALRAAGTSQHAVLPPERAPATRTPAWDAARRLFRGTGTPVGELLAPGEAPLDQHVTAHRTAVAPVLARQHDIVAATSQHVRDLAARRWRAGSEDNVIDGLVHIQPVKLLGLARQRDHRRHKPWSPACRAIGGRPGPVASALRAGA